MRPASTSAKASEDTARLIATLIGYALNAQWHLLNEELPTKSPAILREVNDKLAKNHHQSLLHRAARVGDKALTVTQLLLSLGMDVNAADNNTESALQLATKAGDSIETARLLINCGASLRPPFDAWLAIGGEVDFRTPPLLNAVRSKNVPLVRLLASRARELSAQASWGWFSTAVINDVTSVGDYAGVTALSEAAVSLNTEIVRILVEAGARAGIDDPLREMLSRNNFIPDGNPEKLAAAIEIATLLLQAGAVIHDRLLDGAVYAQAPLDIIKLLLTHAVNPGLRRALNIVFGWHTDEFLYPARLTKIAPTILALVEAGADLRASWDFTPLIELIIKSHQKSIPDAIKKQLIAAFIRHGADPNERKYHDSTQETALFVATEQENYTAVEALLAAGADPDRHTRRGTPRGLAPRHRNTPLSWLFVHHDAYHRRRAAVIGNAAALLTVPAAEPTGGAGRTNIANSWMMASGLWGLVTGGALTTTAQPRLPVVLELTVEAPSAGAGEAPPATPPVAITPRAMEAILNFMNKRR